MTLNMLLFSNEGTNMIIDITDLRKSFWPLLSILILGKIDIMKNFNTIKNFELYGIFLQNLDQIEPKYFFLQCYQCDNISAKTSTEEIV